MDISTRNQIRLALEFLRLAAISGLIFSVGLLVVIFLVGWAKQEKIKSLVIDSLNKQLKTEVFIDDIRLDVFRSFPMAALTIDRATILGSPNDNPADTLLYAQRIQLRFRLTDILRKNYTLKQIVIQQGFARPEYDSRGVSNFNLWDGDAATSNDEFRINLQHIILNQVSVRYHDNRRRQFLSADISKATLGGSFSNESFRLFVKAGMHATSIILDSTFMISGKKVSLDLDLESDSQSRFSFHESRISIDNHAFVLTGNLIQQADTSDLDLHISGRRLNLHELITDLPENWNKYLADYQAKGELDFSASLSGKLSPASYPLIEASFSLKRGEMTHKSSGLRLRELDFAGRYSNGDLQAASTSFIHVSNISARINNGLFKGQGTLENLDMPSLDLSLFADMNAADFASLLNIDTITDATGRMFLDVSFQGSMSPGKKFTGQDLVRARASGNISAKNLGFSLKNSPLKYRNIDGSLTFSQNDLMIESVKGFAGNSDFAVSGYFRNVLPYLFIEGQSIQVDASLRSRLLDFNELFPGGDTDAGDPFRLTFSNRLGFHLQAEVDQLRFRRFEARKLSGTASLQGKRFVAQDVTFNSMNGAVTASGYLDGRNPDILYSGCIATLNKVDVHQLFYQMGNFGQTGILDENIFGIITSDLKFSASWTPTLEVDWNSLVADAWVRIEDGVIVDYEPMNALGRFLRVDDLSRVTFSTLENVINISNRTINIPDMEIKSNVLNLKLSGVHTFENQIAYYMQVLLSDILARKNRQRRNPQEQYGDIIDDGLGRTTLFLKVTGHIDDPVFSYDYQGVTQKLKEGFRQQGSSLRDALRKEFNFLIRPQAGDTVKPLTDRQKEMERLKKQEEGKIILEWDEF